MASISMFELASGELNSGGELHFVWNNPSRERVWQVNVVPSCIDSASGSATYPRAEWSIYLEQKRTRLQHVWAESSNEGCGTPSRTC